LKVNYDTHGNIHLFILKNLKISFSIFQYYTFFKKIISGDGSIAKVVECLPSKCEAPSSNSSTAQEKGEKNPKNKKMNSVRNKICATRVGYRVRVCRNTAGTFIPCILIPNNNKWN
jgi:hypothetical protein